MPDRDDILNEALTLHRAGMLDAAEKIYTAMLALDRQDADALHLLGMIADARGAPARAVMLIGQALQQRESPRFLSNLGLMLGKLGRHEEAVACYRRALELRPAYPEAHNNLGVSLEALNRHEEALACYREALALQPDRAEWWGNAANVLQRLRRHEAAQAAYRRAVELNPANAAAQGALGQAMLQQRALLKAEAAFRAQLALDPQDPEARSNLGVALMGQSRITEAVATQQASLAIAPARAETHHNLALALRQLRRLEEAEISAQLAVSLRPDDPDMLENLGLIQRDAGKLDAAEAVLRHALALRPGAASGYNHLAITLVDQDRLHEALALLDLAQALAPDHADTRHHRAFVLFLLGRMDEGWVEYEARFDTEQGWPDRRGFDQPAWQGEPPDGRTILLHAEQGFGDTVQFCRYAARVAARGARVVLEVQPPLRALLDGFPGIAQIVVRGEALPDFDLHSPLLSLPRLFAAETETIPATTPYLSPPASTLARWQRRLPACTMRRVGIVWAGSPNHANDLRRSIPFPALQPLWAIPGIAWVSLQVGANAPDLAMAPAGLIEDLAPALTDFAETAAAIAQLDLVIAADTAVAHVAGALGKPVFLMLPFMPDWRWRRQGEHSAWYPSMRLFRQDRARDWSLVAKAVAAQLAVRQAP